MKVIQAQQGSSEWLSIRARTLNASEAPAMMGVSPYMTRSELLREKKLGMPREHDAATLARFAAGLEAEAAACAIVERDIVCEELYPIVATDDAGRLLASSDGATMVGDVGFEHKLWNEELAASVRDGVVPESHRWQLDQQIHIFGFEKVLFVVSDGTPDRFVWCAYRTTPDRIERLLAGWDQFERDLAEFVPEPETAKPVGAAPEALPALRIEVTGMVTASNLTAFREHAMTVFSGIKTDLQTDADFADAEKTVKWCKEVEDRLDAAKQHALSQTASIDDLFRTIDAIKEEARQKRLTLDKLVKAEKENRRAEIVAKAQHELSAHIVALQGRVGVLVSVGCNFGEAVKGLKSLDSMRDKVSTALANAKIEANAIADRIDTNRKTVEDMSLVPDFAQVCTKAPDDFAALYAMRKQQRADAESKRLEAERERIRREEEAKARAQAERIAQAERERIRAEEQAKAREAAEAERSRLRTEAEAREQAMQADAAKRAAELKALADVKPEPIPQHAHQPADTGAKLTLGKINQRLSPITLSAAGLAQLGIQPAGKERAAVLYLESDVARICAALTAHLQRACRAGNSRRRHEHGISQ
ncbi:YqaJ viral recombinase family protein [Thauera humireducens]|uniref:YqaJ viral recombinase family protein n=1 Tax=Thauera humireducens TaxID=1134435 RepID=UPI00311F15D6